MGEIRMMVRVLGLAGWSLIAAGPVIAADGGCQGQVDAVKGIVAEHPEAAAEASLRVKLNEAQRLCSANKDGESEDLARQIREQVGPATAGQGSSAGDTSPTPPAAAPAPGR